MNNFRSEHHNGAMLSVLGLIGSGKSSLTRILSKIIRDETGFCEELYEPASKTNPYLADYYRDPSRWGFSIQVYLLNRRLEQHRYAQAMALAGKCSVADSAIHADSCFVSMLEKDGTISKREAETYFDLFRNMSRELLYPTAFIYLDVSPEKALERVAKRISQKESRKCEAGIPVDYMQRLRAEYMELLSSLSRFAHVIRVDWNDDRSDEEIEVEAQSLWTQIKLLRDSMPIPCQIGV